MRKFLNSVFMLAAVVLAACSNDDNGETQPKRGMVLNASVENLNSRATMTTDDESGTWNFAFTENDKVSVSNNKISSYYTFTNNGSQFTSTDAMVTTEPADWYAYFPGNEVDLTNQTGDFVNVANYFAVAGKTAEATTGEKGLSITLKSKVAVLRIVKVDNYGPCDIYLKTADGKYVSGLKAKTNEAGFDVVTSDTKVSVFYKESTGNAGIYYVVVPADVKISVWNDDRCFKTTKDAGLTPGKYYTLTTGPTTGTETATLSNGTTEQVEWVQLWAGGPRFAVKNVAEPMTWYDATKKGDDFAWGSNWYVPSEEDLKIMDELLLKVQVNPTERKVSIEGYPTLELITNTNQEENITKITGFQPGYNKNSIRLYNKIVAETMNTYRLWTATEKDGYGVEFQIIEMDNYFCGGGLSYQTTKNQVILIRPILTAKTILWSNQK